MKSNKSLYTLEIYESEDRYKNRKSRSKDKYRNPRKNSKNDKFKYSNRKSSSVDLYFNGTLIRVWSPTIKQEKDVLKSLKRLSKYPDIYPYIAIMPDYHIGENSVIGSVIPSERLLYVNALGGDLGCGIASLRLPIKVESITNNLRDIYNNIHSRVPCGRRLNIRFSEEVMKMPIFQRDIEVLNKSNTRTAMQQLGTLGSGNHFIEIQKGDDEKINLMVHSGSRELGQIIRKMFSNKAKSINSPNGIIAIPADSQEGKDYMEHMKLALEYSKANRFEILRQSYNAFQENIPGFNIPFEESLEGLIDIPHNQITREDHFGRSVYVHRKGAIYLLENDVGIIPGSMGTSSYLVLGRGNRFSFNSCSHGAGRKMSRGKALNTINMSDYLRSMEGIIGRNDHNILDEAPQAYKDIDQVIKDQRDLIKIYERLKPLASIKG